MEVNDNIAGEVPDFGVRVSRRVIKKIGDLLYGGFGMSQGYQTKGNQHGEINGDGIVEECSYYGLDITDLRFGEEGGGIIIRYKLGGSPVGGLVPGVGSVTGIKGCLH